MKRQTLQPAMRKPVFFENAPRPKVLVAESYAEKTGNATAFVFSFSVFVAVHHGGRIIRRIGRATR
jgi:hypothetical protein